MKEKHVIYKDMLYYVQIMTLDTHTRSLIMPHCWCVCVPPLLYYKPLVLPLSMGDRTKRFHP